jgi:hypothetical protein
MPAICTMNTSIDETTFSYSKIVPSFPCVSLSTLACDRFKLLRVLAAAGGHAASCCLHQLLSATERRETSLLSTNARPRIRLQPDTHRPSHLNSTGTARSRERGLELVSAPSWAATSEERRGTLTPNDHRSADADRGGRAASPFKPETISRSTLTDHLYQWPRVGRARPPAFRSALDATAPDQIRAATYSRLATADV